MKIRDLVFIVLLLFILTIPVEDMLSVNPELSFTRVLGKVAIGAWAVLVLFTFKIRRIHPFFILLVLFLVVNYFSKDWTINPTQTDLRSKTYNQLGIMCIMIWDQVNEKWKLRAAIQTYVIGALISAIGTIVNFVTGQEAYLYSGGRFAATGFNANDLAIILALGVPLAWYLILTNRSFPKFKWFLAINILFILLALFSIFLTGSRAGFLVAMIALLYIGVTLFQFGKKTRAILAILVVVSVIASALIIPQSTFLRILSTFNSGQTDALGGRLGIYQEAAKVIDSHPLLGVGSGAFKSATELNIIAHNTFLSVLSETGMVGFLLFAGMLIITGLEILRQPKQEAYLWAAVFFIWGLGGSSVSWDFRKPTWLILILIVTSAELYIEEARRKKAIQVSPELVRINASEYGIADFSNPLTRE